MNAYCPDCGLLNRADASFCMACGGTLPLTSTQEDREGRPPPPPPKDAPPRGTDEYDTQLFGMRPTRVKASSAPAAPKSGAITTGLRLGYASCRGVGREANEDALIVIGQAIAADAAPSSAALLAVIDGSGPALLGAAAAQSVARSITSGIQHGILQPLAAAEPVLPEAAVSTLDATVRSANHQLLRLGKSSGAELLASLTLALVLEQRAWVVSIGDTRAYQVTGGTVRQLTRDDSYVASLVESGDAEPEAFSSHPRRFVLTRALGQAAELGLRARSVHLAPHDRLVICSDGIWRSLGNRLEFEIHSSAEPQACCDHLIQQAVRFGADDDASVVILRLDPTECTPAPVPSVTEPAPQGASS